MWVFAQTFCPLVQEHHSQHELAWCACATTSGKHVNDTAGERLKNNKALMWCSKFSLLSSFLLLPRVKQQDFISLLWGNSASLLLDGDYCWVRGKSLLWAGNNPSMDQYQRDNKHSRHIGSKKPYLVPRWKMVLLFSLFVKLLL